MTRPFSRGDCNQDGGFNIADPIAMLAVLFPSTSPPPVLPAPEFPTCGVDPTSDPLDWGNAAFCP